MSSWAKPGVNCVCVDPTDLGIDTGVLSLNAQYTIREVLVQTDFTGRTRMCVRLNEIVRGVCPRIGVDDLGFYVGRFRPLTNKTQEQDVSMFKSLLNKTPINETA